MNYPNRLGIVGGGQLGKMLTIAAKKLGFYVTIIDPTPQSPAGQVADRQIVADYKDPKAIIELSKNSDCKIRASCLSPRYFKCCKNV